MGELKKNITYSLILTGSRLLFPIITYPYVSRVLGPEKMGILNFSESYSAYFILIAAVGIPLYGVKEIAKVRSNQKTLNKVFSEISIIYLISTIVCLLGFSATIYFIPKLRQEVILNYLFGFNILLTFLSFEWFFIGIEKFKYITTRSLITKLIPVVLMFFFVKEENDYIIYQLLSTLALLGNSLVNIYFLRDSVSLDFSSLRILDHIKPMTHVFLSSVFISFYPLIDMLILGFLYSYSSVGIYSASLKLNRIMGLIIASIGNVIFPRIAFIIGNRDDDQLKELLNKSVRLTIFITIPSAVLLFMLSEEIIMLLFGIDFTSSILPAQILAPIVIFMGLSNIYYWQILLPFSKERLLLMLFLSVSVVSLILNFALAYFLNYTGSALAVLIVEFFLLILAVKFSRQVLIVKIPWRYTLHCLLISLVFVPLILSVRLFAETHWIVLAISLMICGLIYFGIQHFAMKDSIAEELVLYARKIF